MTQNGKVDPVRGATEAEDVESSHASDETKQSKPADNFLSHQDGLTVPEPAYYRHLKDEAEQNEFEHTESFETGEHGGRWSSPPSAPDPAALQKRERSRRMRFWIYIALIVLIYVVFRTVDLMH